MTISEIRQILDRRGIQLTKSLGQNFLFDQNQLRKIAAAAQLSKHDKVLEIGPGLGPLTELLVSEAAEVIAIEKDARLVEVLQERFESHLRQSNPKAEPNFRLVHDDALEWLRREARDWPGWKMVSNLPYSVASPILVELAMAIRGPERLVATLQLEVARRLVAQPGNSAYGILTLLVQLQYEPAGSFKIPATCFFPEPEVDSACVCLARRSDPLLRPEQRRTFVQIVKLAFSQRRKMMFKLLKAHWPREILQEAFERTRLSPAIRAESVTLEKFVELTRLLLPDSPNE
jgi:16S rRNA (adenine1518-N6/adenine1519-N6)-dimethyltransferase